MALYHFSADHVSRGAGQSLIAAWAYDSRSKLRDERTGTTYNHSKDDFDLLDQGAVGLDCPPAELIARIEAAEKRSDAALGMTIIAAGQRELKDENADVAKRFCEEVNKRWGLPAAWALHRAPTKKSSKESGKKPLYGNTGNFHLHIILGLRPIGKDGKFSKKKFDGFTAKFGQKNQTIDALAECRKLWETLTNEALEKADPGGVKVSCLSYEEQGLDIEPTYHEGAAVTYQRRKGKLTDRAKENDAIKARNAKRREAAKTAASADTKAAPAAAKASPATTEKPDQIAAAVAAPSTPQVTSPVTQVTPPIATTKAAPHVPQTGTSQAAKTTSSNRKLTNDERQRITDRILQVPSIGRGLDSHTRERAGIARQATLAADTGSRKRRSRVDEMERLSRAAQRAEFEITAAAGRGAKAAGRTRTARGERVSARAERARIRETIRAVKLIAKKLAEQRNPKLHRAAKLGEKKMGEALHDLATGEHQQGPSVTTVDLSKLDNLGSLLDSGTPNRGPRSR